jgi:hypothetical protein
MRVFNKNIRSLIIEMAFMGHLYIHILHYAIESLNRWGGIASVS